MKRAAAIATFLLFATVSPLSPRRHPTPPPEGLSVTAKGSLEIIVMKGIHHLEGEDVNLAGLLMECSMGVSGEAELLSPGPVGCGSPTTWGRWAPPCCPTVIDR
jgi:hypothetical protein